VSESKFDRSMITRPPAMCDPDGVCSVPGGGKKVESHDGLTNRLFNGAVEGGPHIRFYGASWCPDCVRSKAFLDLHKVAYEYFNTDVVGRPDLGRKRIPTIVFADSSFLQEPSDAELAAKCAAAGHAVHA